jgi:hypothetical protein
MRFLGLDLSDSLVASTGKPCWAEISQPSPFCLAALDVDTALRRDVFGVHPCVMAPYAVRQICKRSSYAESDE